MQHALRTACAFALFALASAPAWAQIDSTLQHLPPNAPLTFFPYDGMTGGANPQPEWGYLTGHNIYGDEAWAEKYYFEGNTVVKGIVSHHFGTRAAGSTQTVRFRVHPVGPNGLPGGPLDSKTVNTTELDLTGGPTVTTFSTPIAVSDSFFVAFNLGHWSHGAITDTIGLLCGEPSSRADDDLNVYGRNAVLWHGHGPVPPWKDFYTENFSPIATHFAIYPIVEFTPTHAGSSVQQHTLTLFAHYPNPAVTHTTVHFSLARTELVSIGLFDLTGRQLYASAPRTLPVGEHRTELPTQGLAAGQYLYVVTAGHTRLSSVVTVR